MKPCIVLFYVNAYKIVNKHTAWLKLLNTLLIFIVLRISHLHIKKGQSQKISVDFVCMS